MGRSRKSVFYVTGSKGGVGKSIVAMALTDFLLSRGQEPVALIESDLSNPDLAKTCGSIVGKCESLELDEAEGWIDLANFCGEWEEHHIVVNTGARNLRGVERHGRIVRELHRIERNFVALWTINAQRDSLELLHDYREAMWDPEQERPLGTIHVVCNSGVNYQKQFKLYEDSDVAKDIEKEGGKVIVFPTLAKRVADDLYSERIAISEACGAMPFGNRAELNRWRRDVWALFEKLLKDELTEPPA